jgi:predicted TIM-barrel fold metal-dependent hydrolase
MSKSNEIIDCHVHITESGKWYNTNYDASVNNLLKQMDEAKINKSVILPIRGATSNLFIKKTCETYSDRFIGFGNVSCKTWKDDLKQILDYDLKGIKFHPRIQNESILEWDQIGLLNEIQKLNLPLLICGWQQTSSIVANMKNLQPIIIDEIAKKYPNLKIIIAHMGGHKYLDAFFCARSNPNVYLDCSYFFTFFKNTSLERDALVLFNKLDEKILFGSDFPECNIPNYLNYLNDQANEYEIDLSKMMNNFNKIH